MKPTLRVPRAFFNYYVTPEVQEELVRIIFRGYRHSFDELLQASYKDEQIHDLYPYARRTKIDGYLGQLSSRFPEVSTRIQLNKARNSHHTLVILGNIICTASAVEYPTDLPREAIFRNIYAGSQIEFDIKEDENILKILNDLPPPDARLYALIIHGPVNTSVRNLPGFIRIAFPGRHYFTRLDDDIDLYAKYKDVTEEMSREGTEVIEDKVEVKLIENVPLQEKLL